MEESYTTTLLLSVLLTFSRPFFYSANYGLLIRKTAKKKEDKGASAKKKKEHKKRNEVKLDDVTMQPVSFVIVDVRLRYTQGTFFFLFFSMPERQLLSGQTAERHVGPSFLQPQRRGGKRALQNSEAATKTKKKRKRTPPLFYI